MCLRCMYLQHKVSPDHPDASCCVQMVIKMSLLPSAMDDLAKNVQSRLTSMLMRYR